MGHRLHWAYCVFILCLSAATEIRADEELWKLYVDRFQVYRRKGAFPEAEKAALAAIAEAEKSGAESELLPVGITWAHCITTRAATRTRRNSSCVPSAARIIRPVPLRQ